MGRAAETQGVTGAATDGSRSGHGTRTTQLQSEDC